MRGSLVWAMLTCFVSVPCCNVAHGQTRPDVPPPNVEKVAPDNPVDERTVDERLVDALYRNAFSKDKLIRENSYGTLLKNKKLLESLGDGNQRELAKSGMDDENLVIVRMAFAILKQSGLNTVEKQDLLIGVIATNNDWLRNEALEYLSLYRDDVLKRLIEAIENDPGGSHKNAIRLIEHWGSHASDAVPVLIKNFEAIKKTAAGQASARSRSSRRPLAFDYLHLVYAIAEIGPAARDALPIALTAAEEKSTSYYRKQYAVAGSICVDRLIDGNALSDLARVAPSELKKSEKYSDKLLNSYDTDEDGRLSQNELVRMRLRPPAADTNKDGFLSRDELTLRSVHSTPRMALYLSMPVRDIVKAYLAGEKERIEARSSRPNVDRQVELIFQNHDVFGPSNHLCVREVRNIEPPMLISEVDKDDDQMISKEELKGYLSGQDPEDWPLAR